MPSAIDYAVAERVVANLLGPVSRSRASLLLCIADRQWFKLHQQPLVAAHWEWSPFAPVLERATPGMSPTGSRMDRHRKRFVEATALLFRQQSLLELAAKARALVEEDSASNSVAT